MIGINTLTSVEQPIYSNHIQFFYRLGRHYVDKIDFAINTPKRMSIDRMRNQTAKLALEHDFDYVLFIDDDVVVPINSLQKLLACEADIAAGWTIIRGHPFHNMFFKHPNGDKSKLENYKTEDIKEVITPCDAVGFSCALIKCSLLKKLQPPFFVTGPYNTEDIYFCVKARHEIPETTIVVDTSIQTFHMVGPEFVGPENVKAYKEYVENAWPELIINEKPPIDRGDSYLELVTK